MGKVIIQAENQLKRINELANRIKETRELPLEKLIQRPKEKSWCVLEVIKHMSLGQDPYNPKIDKALSYLPSSEEVMNSIPAKGMGALMMKQFVPTESGKIKLKMKTFRRFQPVMDLSSINNKEAVHTIIDEFLQHLQKLHTFVEDYRLKKVEQKRFNSAIGAMVRFNVAEACEFIIRHNERHLQQIENTLNTLDSSER